MSTIKNIFNKVAKLIDVKSIMTLTLTGVFAYLSLTHVVDVENYMAIYTMIVGFYFGVQATKDGGKNE